MNASQPGKPFYESFGFKLFVAIAIIIIFTVVFLIQTRPGERSTAVNPAKRRQSPAIQIPPPEPTGQHSSFPTENWPAQAEPAPVVPGQAVTRELPMNAAPVARPQTLPSPAPVTQVHPLSEAEAVMGPASGEVGEVGVTRTYRLPGQEGKTKTAPLPADPQKP